MRADGSPSVRRSHNVADIPRPDPDVRIIGAAMVLGAALLVAGAAMVWLPLGAITAGTLFIAWAIISGYRA